MQPLCSHTFSLCAPAEEHREANEDHKGGGCTHPLLHPTDEFVTSLRALRLAAFCCCREEACTASVPGIAAQRTCRQHMGVCEQKKGLYLWRGPLELMLERLHRTELSLVDLDHAQKKQSIFGFRADLI